MPAACDPSPSPRADRRIRVLTAIVGLLVTVGGCGRVDHYTQAVDLQRKVLAAESGKPRKRDIDQLIRHVDRLDREQLRQLRDTLAGEIRDGQRVWIDRYFSASASERPAILDADIERLLAIRELWLAITPGATTWSPRLGRPRGGKEQTQDDATFRKLRESYTTALLAHAKTRGVTLPELQ